MSFPDPGIADRDAVALTAALEARYRQDDLASSHAERSTRVDFLGYGRWMTAYVVKRANGQSHDDAVRAVLAEIDAVLQPPAPQPQPTPTGDVSRLHADSLVLRRADNSLPFILGITSFRLPELWCLDRPKALRWLDFCQAYGLAPRGLCMYWGGIGRFDPRSVSDFFPQMRGLALECASRGLRLLIDGCADLSQPGSPLASIVPADFADELARNLYDLPNVVEGGGNEAPFNGWAASSLRRATGNFLWHRGTNGGDALPPVWAADCFANEGNRGGVATGNWVKSCKALYDVQSGNTSEGVGIPLPALEMEPIGCGELDEEGRTSSNPDHWFDYAAGCKLFGDGLVIHARAGIVQMDPPGPRAIACIKAAIAGAAAMPDDARLGRYTRGPLADCPLSHDDTFALRTYARIQGDSAICVALVPQPGWKERTVAIAPWRIVEQRGPRGNVVLVAR